ncbi:cytochrome P450 [Leucobacter viscericola]|uniref:Cytochrome P450 n=1 Tax=Leucobacter viscericola TaxID=2714935 RepID=A0A6G7XBA8_9MICO|nr:cytochrome P450 [Leucobacter viscericola]QIK61884.1 cytochrome P450 [Leucobacter viscericola]
MSVTDKWEDRVMRAAHPLAFPALSALKKPVTRVPGLGVVVLDAGLIRSTLLDTNSFSKIGKGAPSDIWTPLLGPSVLLNMEGKDHQQLRRRLAPLFTPSYVNDLVNNSLGEVTRRLTERLVRGETVDVVAEARHYASIAISNLVGLPESATDDEFFRSVTSVTSFVTLTRPRMSSAQLRRAREVLAGISAHADRAYDAGDEKTVPGRMRALGFSRDESRGIVGAFVVAGTETLVAFIPRMVCLLSDSGWLARLAAQPELSEMVIAEALRVVTPSPVMLRCAIADSHIGGQRVKTGDRVILGTYWGNRGLEGFDPQSSKAASLKQLWFGAGPHFCIGAPLAMTQIRLVLGAIAAAEHRAPLTVTHREPSRRVLIPGYQSVRLGKLS